MRPATPRPVADPAMEAYAAAHSAPPSALLETVAGATRAWSDAAEMMIDPLEARLLALLVHLCDARDILEVGTFTGFSALAMAEALPPGGRIVTLELRADHAAKAREHITLAGMQDRITIVEGPAAASLERLEGPFDLAFIDADKPGYPGYYEAVVPLMRPNGLVVVDNVLRGGRVLDLEPGDIRARATHALNERVASDPRVEAVMLTVRDGVTLIRVRA